jgi:ribosome-binding protein aMBF1 (putative translation factor)
MTERKGLVRLNKTRATMVRRSKRPKPVKAPKNTFALVLEAARERKGLTRSAMAHLCGVAGPVITRIESGRQGAGEATIRRYAKVLGMRVELKLVRKSNKRKRR